MAVTVYRSTDTSAPVLHGDTSTAPTLIPLLDACLVTGYGSKAAAGWTKPYTGTARAVFRQGAGNQFYLNVNEGIAGGVTANDSEAMMRGYEAMTAQDTGTLPFPTGTQMTNGVYLTKSNVDNTTARAWTLIADDSTFYFFTYADGSQYVGFMFGDFYSFASGTDNYRTIIIGRTATGTSSAAEHLERVGNLSAAMTGHYAARAVSGLGASTQVMKFGTYGATNGSSFLNGLMTAANPADGKYWVAPVYIGELPSSVYAIRGRMRGFYHFLHATSSFADGDTISGAGDYAGRTFQLFKSTMNGSHYCFDITGPWEAN